MGTNPVYLGRKGQVCSFHPKGMLLPFLQFLKTSVSQRQSAKGEGRFVSFPAKVSLEWP